MEPTRPNIEATPDSDMRSSVGNISAVNTYMALNAMEIANLLPKNDNSFMLKWSENGIDRVRIYANYDRFIKNDRIIINPAHRRISR